MRCSGTKWASEGCSEGAEPSISRFLGDDVYRYIYICIYDYIYIYIYIYIVIICECTYRDIQTPHSLVVACFCTVCMDAEARDASSNEFTSATIS